MLLDTNFGYKAEAAFWKEEALRLDVKCDELDRQRAVLADVIKQYLSKNYPEGFGCMCTTGRKCGTCRAYDSQQHLRQALSAAQEKP